MPFGVLSRVDQGYHALDGDADAPVRTGTFRRVYRTLQSIEFWGLGERVRCAKTVGPLGIAIRLLSIYTV